VRLVFLFESSLYRWSIYIHGSWHDRPQPEHVFVFEDALVEVMSGPHCVPTSAVVIEESDDSVTGFAILSQTQFRQASESGQLLKHSMCASGITFTCSNDTQILAKEMNSSPFELKLRRSIKESHI
jgi:hypothetical protein